MQSDGNSFFGDVDLDSFDKESRDEDNIFDQIYENKYVWINSKMILTLYNITWKCYTNTTVALKPNFMSSLL